MVLQTTNEEYSEEEDLILIVFSGVSTNRNLFREEASYT